MSNYNFEKQSRLIDQFDKATCASQNENAQTSKKAVLTEILEQLEQFAEARDAEAAAPLFEANSTAFPETLWTALFRVEAFFAHQKFENAKEEIADLKKILAEKSEASNSLSRLIAQAEEFELLFDELAKSALENPDNEAGLQEIWTCAEMSGRHQDSLILHQKIVDLRPYSAWGWFNLGQAHLNLGDEEQALEAFEYAYLADRSFELAWQAFGKLAFERGDFERALRCYKEMIHEIDKSSDALVRVGECHEKMGRPLLAMSFFREAIDEDADNSEAFFRLGLSLFSEERLRESAAALESAIQLENRHDEYHAALAATYWQLGLGNKAAKKIQRAIFLAPEETKHWLQFAKIQLHSGKVEKALEVISDCEENAFLDAELLYCRTACFFLMRDREEAFETLDAAMAEDFSKHAALFDHAPMLREDQDLQARIAAFSAD